MHFLFSSGPRLVRRRASKNGTLVKRFEIRFSDFVHQPGASPILSDFKNNPPRFQKTPLELQIYRCIFEKLWSSLQIYKYYYVTFFKNVYINDVCYEIICHHVGNCFQKEVFWNQSGVFWNQKYEFRTPAERTNSGRSFENFTPAESAHLFFIL